MPTELYRNVPTIPVKGRQFSELHGEPILGNDPFADAVIPELSLAEVKDGWLDEPELDQPFVTLRRVSPYHGRSLELQFGGDERVVWRDEFGTLFTTMNTKGNSFKDPKIILTRQPAPSPRYATYGLQDTESILRVLQASRMLRSLGIPTEAICRVIDPKEIVYGDNVISQEELKTQLLAEVALRKKRERVVKDGFFMPSNEETERVAKYLQQTMFVETVRATQVSERLRDVAYSETKDEFLQMVGKAFDFLNFQNKLDGENDADVLDVNNPGHQRALFTQIIPERLGKAFAKLHNAGLSHGFPHAGNISIVGTLYDLDSIKGEPLGDAAITRKNIGGDLLTVQYDIAPLIGHLYRTGLLGTAEEKMQIEDTSEDHMQPALLAFGEFTENFYTAYFAEITNPTFDILSVFPDLEIAIYFTTLTGETGLLNQVAERVEKRLGRSFSYTGDVSGLVDVFFARTATDIQTSIELARSGGSKVTMKDLDALIDALVNGSALRTETLEGSLVAPIGKEIDASYTPKLRIRKEEKRKLIKEWIALREVTRIYETLKEEGRLDQEIEKLKASLVEFVPDEDPEETEQERKFPDIATIFVKMFDEREAKEATESENAA